MDVKKEEIIILGKNACFIALICGILFILVLFAAMFAYPGGYDFWGYYISSLGAVQAENGSNNFISRILFFGAMSIGTYSLLFFWLISYHLLEELNCQESNFILVKKLPCQQIITFGSIMGLIATPFMILIAIIPTDDLPSLHELVTIIFFICLCIALLIYSVGIVLVELKDRKESNYYILFTIMVFVSSAILVGLMLYEIISLIEIGIIAAGALVVIGLVILINRLLNQLIDYLSFISSVFMILLIVGIMVLFRLEGINPQLEISLVWGMVIWNIIQILKVWPIVPEERKKFRKRPREFVKKVKQEFLLKK